MPATQGEKATGLVWRKRSNGSQVAYWSARPDLIKAGYRPKSVRLHYAADDPALAQRCRVLQAEMMEWATGQGRGTPSAYDGTFASLVRFYETHPDSPYHDLQPATQTNYSKTMALLMRNKGSRLVAKVDGADIGRWYKELVEASSKGWAYYTVNVLKAALSFGASKRIAECSTLRAELREVRFGAGKRRKEYLTYPQVMAFYDKAHEMGLGWMARCLLIQFEFGIRRRDVIGMYFTDESGEGAIRIGKRVWRDGITWGNIDEHGVFRRLVSKTALTSEEEAVHVVADYPKLVAELALTPTAKRIGPIIINPKTGVPPTEAQCRRAFRRIAAEVGISDNVQGRDARAGADTEAYEAGATKEEAMALLTHTQESTNRGYLREKIEQSRRAASKRVASRKEG